MAQQIPAWAYVPMGIKDHEGKNFAETKKFLEKDEGESLKPKSFLKPLAIPVERASRRSL